MSYDTDGLTGYGWAVRAEHDPDTCPACRIKTRMEDDVARLLGDTEAKEDE
jgi:hypothetical protein